VTSKTKPNLIGTKITLKEAEEHLSEEERREVRKRYRALLKAIKKSGNNTDIRTVGKALRVAMKAHRHQRRKSGEPYIYHPLQVATIVAEIGLTDTTSIVAALLHDVVEDTDLTLEDISQMFGTTVAELVDGLTKVSKLSHSAVIMPHLETYRKILLALAKDVRVVIIKIADRLDNMRSLDALPEHKRVRIAMETRYLYAPLAHRLGLYSIKTELEDLALKHLNPKQYYEIEKWVKKNKEKWEKILNRFVRQLRIYLRKAGYNNFTIEKRIKAISSIYDKLVRKKDEGITLNEIYDVLAVRIVLDVPPETEDVACYDVLRVVHKHFPHIPDRVRDWISHPKANGYQSLHTTVIGPEGKHIEVQIRSVRMHEVAEKGIAAHWKYKQGVLSDKVLEEWFARVREILAHPEKDPHLFLEDMKLNLFDNEIHVFTPKGEIITLPKGATVLDFAFHIHTQLGYHCIGAKVNNKVVEPTHVLNDGDQVEVLTAQSQTPQPEWLTVVKTAIARRALRRYFRRAKKELINKGKEKVKKFFAENNIKFVPSNLKTLVKYLGFKDVKELYYAVGRGDLSLKMRDGWKVEDGKLIIEKPLTLEEQLRIQLHSSTIQEFEGKSFQKCCTPLPGDNIVIFQREDGALEIHHSSCEKAAELLAHYGAQIIKTKWEPDGKISFMIRIRVKGTDRKGVVYDLSRIISKELDMNMQGISIESDRGQFSGYIDVFVSNREQLDNLIKRLEKVPYLHSVEVAEGQLLWASEN